MNEMSLESLRAEVRARILWGDSAEEVRAWLQEQGAASHWIDMVMKDVLRERASTVRKIGMRKMLTGTGALVLAALIFVVQWRLSLFSVRLSGFASIGVLCGAWQLLSGITEYTTAGSVKGSLSNQ